MSHPPANIAGSPLGATVAYRDRYAPELLFPVSRAPQRQDIGIIGALPFHGVDIWNAYELSWLDPRGKPIAATARFDVPIDSPNIVESKSIKLYLNSFNQTQFYSAVDVQAAITKDLSAAAGAMVTVTVEPLLPGAQRRLGNFAGVLLDNLEVDIGHYHPAPELLKCHGDGWVEEVLVSHLLKSNCPVTGQPDWASVRIAYRGRAIDHAGLLAYIVSYRQHSGFHEHCVERIYADIAARCAPEKLSVYARYTRRGGLDINPFRSSEAGDMPENDGDIRQ
ncbi:MAG: NADPH-dependent 7-cyano-7-deazaguanine reductase QueF [Rhodocyclaceae bacterium]|nr:MAG: NADPH-dependent 7-cyano-7-deazaguanine reductase QueF [Rhodocyclaceae bacterium]